MIGHRLMGTSLLFTGDITQGRAHYDQAIALYDPAEHRPLATRFGQDVRVAILSYRSLALWLLGYPEAALADAEPSDQGCARDRPSCHFDVCAGPCTVDPFVAWELRGGSNAHIDEVVALADEKGAFVLEGGRNGFTKVAHSP